MMSEATAAGVIGLLLTALVSAAAAAPGDFVLPRKGASAGAAQFPLAAFPHTLHRVLFKCYVCHDSPFKMKVGADAMTMDAMGDGKFCGACHDGKTTFDTSSFDNCDRCHQK